MSLLVMTLLVAVALGGSIALTGLLERRRAKHCAEAPLSGWYKMRQTELQRDSQVTGAGSEDVEMLEQELQLSLVENASGTSAGIDNPPVSSIKLASALTALMLIFSFFTYHQYGGYQDVILSQALDEVAPEEDAIENLISQVEKRVSQRPENIHYWNILGRYYTSVSRYDDAVDAFDHLLTLVPEDASVMAQAAQADYLAGGRTLSPRAQQLALDSLKLEPGQSTALGLLGMAFFEAGEFAFAIEFWQRLLRTSTAQGEPSQVIERAISRARSMLASQGSSPAVPGMDIAVQVQLSLPVGGGIDPSATVFVFARSPDFPMPLAVQRMTVADLPATIRLSDAQSMTPQATISAGGDVRITARISPSGAPGAESATHEASSDWVTPLADPHPVVRLSLQPVTDSSSG